MSARPPGSDGSRHRLLLCDDDAAFRAFVRAVLGRHDDLAVVAEAADGRACVEQVALLRPDAVLLDLDMPELDGVAAIPVLREAAPATRVVVLTSRPAERMGAHVRDLGAHGYLEKGGAGLAERLPDAVRAALAR